MLTLYMKPDCPRCSRIRDALEELAVAHEVEEVDGSEEVPEKLGEGELPVLVDEGEVFEGPGAVSDHLQQVEEFKQQWYKFQSDACYCDE